MFPDRSFLIFIKNIITQEHFSVKKNGRKGGDDGCNVRLSFPDYIKGVTFSRDNLHADISTS